MSGDVVLDARGVVVHLGGRTALDGVDLQVRRGELVALVGPNGAGKTTLLRALLGLVPRVAGRVEILGRDRATASSAVGYVPQRHEFAWDFPISVGAAVRAGRTSGLLRRPTRRLDRELADRALADVGLGDLVDRPIGELSGGQRQRVLVARALARDPELLLLDEPSSGVDVPTQELLDALFVSLAGRGRTILVTTHDLATATRACSRLCLLNRRVVADGTPADLRDPAVWLEAFGVARADQLGALLRAPTS